MTRIDRLLLLASLAEAEMALAAWEQLRPRFEYEHLTGEHYRLAPLLGWNLEQAGLSPVADVDLARLLGLTRRTWVQSQRHLATLGDVSALLDGVGVRAVAIKGAALLRMAYPEPGLRPMEDLDILVDRPSLQRAAEALATAGFRLDHVAPDGHAEQWVAPGGIEVDLHTRPSKWLVENHGGSGTASMRHRAVQVGLPDGRSVFMADAADQLLVTFLHGISGTTARLRWIADATWLARASNVDWDHFLAQTTRFAVTGLAARAAEIAEIATGTSVVPPEIVERLHSMRWTWADRLALAAMDHDRFPTLARSVAYAVHALPPEERLRALPTVATARVGAESLGGAAVVIGRRIPPYMWSSAKAALRASRGREPDPWQPRRVLVTGVDSPVGRRVSEQLQQRRYEVVGLDRARGSDVRRPSHVLAAVRGCDAIVHLAAVPWNSSWRSSLATNVWGALVVVGAGRLAGARRVVYVSSFQVTGAFMGRRPPARLPFDERHPKRPSTPYSHSKLWAEHLCRILTVTDRTATTVVVRPPAVWEDDRFERERLKWLADETRQWRPFWEYGAFIHVDDLAELLVLAVGERLAPGHEELTVSGPDCASRWTTFDLVEHLHPSVPWRSERDRRAVMTTPYASLIDSSRAHTLLGWTPRRPFHGHR